MFSLKSSLELKANSDWVYNLFTALVEIDCP